MKKMLCMFVVIVAILVPSIACATNYDVCNLYALTTMIIEVNHVEDYVVCLDFNGNEWIFEGVEDWCIHDFASLLMWDNETDNIEDDIIINAFYSGYVPN